VVIDDRRRSRFVINDDQAHSMRSNRSKSLMSVGIDTVEE